MKQGLNLKPFVGFRQKGDKRNSCHSYLKISKKHPLSRVGDGGKQGRHVPSPIGGAPVGDFPPVPLRRQEAELKISHDLCCQRQPYLCCFALVSSYESYITSILQHKKENVFTRM